MGYCSALLQYFCNVYVLAELLLAMLVYPIGVPVQVLAYVPSQLHDNTSEKAVEADSVLRPLLPL